MEEWEKILSLVLFLSFSFPLSFSSLSFIEENQTEVDQQRSARVHRVSDREFTGNEDSQLKNAIKDIVIKQAVLLGSEEIEKFLTDFPNLSNLVQHEASLEDYIFSLSLSLFLKLDIFGKKRIIVAIN